MSLDDIFTEFNVDHPADFTGHSLSVSDVVVLHQDGRTQVTMWIPLVTGRYRSLQKKSAQKKMRPGKQRKSPHRKPPAEEIQKKNNVAEPDNDKVSYYVIEDLSTWAENSPEKSKLERFDSLPKAITKFAEYQGKETEDQPDMAKGNFGFNVNGSEFDLIHVRNHEKLSVTGFYAQMEGRESSRFMDDLQTLYDKVGFDKVRVHREMSPEEVKDFVKQRFEYQLKSSGSG